ncbi:MAG: nickel pincer cofactor biosynthesis protein LarB [Nitrososphaerales archaeon]
MLVFDFNLCFNNRLLETPPLMFHSTRDILDAVRSGSLSVTRAERLLKLDALAIVDEIARLDINRQLRRGVPEVIYAGGKSNTQLSSILERIVTMKSTNEGLSRPVILSKVRPDQFRSLQTFFRKRAKMLSSRGLSARIHGDAGIVVLYTSKNSFDISNLGRSAGRVALLAAGTSDIPALTEAEVVLNAMRCKTIRYNDVGVSALKRLSRPLKEIQRFDPDALVVAAGMEAALPSLIAGLSGVAVIGLPTSVGYGYGRNGEAALMSMLQACPLGICVVNIDGGVAAGVIAALIANRCSEMRRN